MQTMTKCKTNCPYIDEHIGMIRSGEIQSSKKLKQAADYIERKLLPPADVIIDTEKIDKAIELIERYFGMILVPWERFVISLVHCYYRRTDTVVFDEFFIMMGRGNGKNGFISGLAWYLTTPAHGVRGYNVDIIANSEDQAKTSFNDVYEMLEDTWDKSQRFFSKTKEEIRNIRTKSYIHYNTSNARTKDGKRSACLIFDEEHEYENAATIGVFQSGFGKRKHSRIFKITTNGYVRDGVLDDDLRLADDVLNGVITNIGLCPLIYMMDSEEECNDPTLWEKANPSINYFPELRKQIEKEFIEKEYKSQVKLDFYTKRMNRPRTNLAVQVTEWENIAATNQPIPDLSGQSCICGIDYASFRDFASVNLHFTDGVKKYDINHSWLCLKSPELSRIRAPWQQWADAGHITAVDDVQISPELLTQWIEERMQKYNIIRVQVDGYRFALVAKYLAVIGFDTKERKNIRLIKNSDIGKIVPVIESDFLNGCYVWGDNPVLRWATNNACVVSPGKSDATSSGNRYYGKIEPKSRKTDPFMAFVASVVGDDDLIDSSEVLSDDIDPEIW
ncbi:MAG: terminase large subunit [Oscillospiraceae bacterium]